ncbi:MAG: signal recognition particle receptor subunit alpha [Candidatus Burarchaeum sp.]|nr:signal recognition particle receptor subunit alpha [Candidatus Burarchaeum sp.]MDO8340107.1 signal recognition particle receptor subunit alpha [Candidatus Burarchaeum sp.]
MDLGTGLRRALKKLTGAALVDERVVRETVKEIQRVLIMGDMNVALVSELSKRIEARALDEKALKGVDSREHVVKVVYEELAAMLGEKHEPKIAKQKIMLLGLFGSGKTTTAGKLAHFFKKKGLSVAMICCDVARPAAYEQLQQVAERAGAHFYGKKGEIDASKIAREALAQAKEDVLILDSAGRSAFDDELSHELKQINAEFKPDEKLLVLNADIGQVAKKQADEFNKAVGLTGVIITKMDGSGKGGGALSAVAASGTKVSFIGTGEKQEDLELFDAKKFVGRLLGFPDLEALIEKVNEVSAESKIDEKALLEDKFTIRTFYEQLKAAKKMGPLKGVFQMLGAPDIPKDMVEQSEEKLKAYEVMINSMTPAEREDVALLKKNRSRLERIARGSGRKPEDVRDLLSQFEKVQKMMGQFKHNRGFRRQMEKMMKGGFPGMPGAGN